MSTSLPKHEATPMPVITTLSLSGLCAVTIHLPASRVKALITQPASSRHPVWVQRLAMVKFICVSAARMVIVCPCVVQTQATSLNEKLRHQSHGAESIPVRRVECCGLLKACAVCGSDLCNLHCPGRVARRLTAPGITLATVRDAIPVKRSRTTTRASTSTVR